MWGLSHNRLRVEGLGFKVSGVWGLGGLGIGVQGLGFWVWRLGFRDSGFGAYGVGASLNPKP